MPGCDLALERVEAFVDHLLPDLIANICERQQRAWIDFFRVEDVKAEGRAHDPAGLVRPQRKRGFLERRHHDAAHNPAKLAALGLRRIGVELGGEIAEIPSRTERPEGELRLRFGCNDDLAYSHTLTDSEGVLVGLVIALQPRVGEIELVDLAA